MTVRGILGIGLGAIALWPAVGLGELITLFGVYTLLDGIAAVAWGVYASRRRPLTGSPVLLEGIFSIGLGVLALGHPFTSARFVELLAVWALVTGILEIVAAMRLPRGLALAAGGAWSMFLGLMLLALPHAMSDALVAAIAVYALVFGVLVLVAAVTHRCRIRLLPIGPAGHTWTTR
ncbi:MAG TPA: DUF308 domain-containing protein [Methylomirabilota bacterium]|nr:DUF308 domain-containing protein [Methylomirabilota bacterium]